LDINEVKDQVTIKDENGNNKEYKVQAMFEMANERYAILSSSEEVALMRIKEDENQQTFEEITNPEEKASLFSAHALEVEASREPNIISD
jgi:hypothetical protein